MSLRTPSRRQFLKTVVVTAGAASVAPSLLACESAIDPSGTFPQSIASGDPRQSSIVLWTRLEASGDAMVRLELATDEAFSSLVSLSESRFLAEEAHDHCVRVKVEGLRAGTRYFYRFEHAGVRSRAGRFRTAADPSSDEAVRFAVISCQDFVGRYYNTLLKLFEPENDGIDFVVHLGDYIYETTGDPSFMMASADRRVTLSDTAGAIALMEDGQTYHAARSLENYRELYRQYRSDPLLQRAHERFAFVITWDDHEFSDDSWQDHATYSGGRAEEQDRERRRNAEQAFLEYQPIARESEDAGLLAPDRLYPDNAIYRDLRFGRHAHLVITDDRSFRPDHAIPESAWPGAVAVREDEVRAVLARRETERRLPSGTTAEMAFESGGYSPYVDLSEAAYARHRMAARAILAALYEASAVAPERAGMLADAASSGAADVAVLNALLEENRAMLPASLMDVAAIDASDPSLERGISYSLLGKRSLVGSIGARYLVVASHYDTLSEHRDATLREDVWGERQRAFVEAAIAANADATWTLLGSSVAFAPLVLDVRPFAAQLPPGFPAAEFYLNADQWDGFPREKERVLAAMRARNAVILSGDIHAAYLTDHADPASGDRAIEITCPGVSSSSFRGLLYGSAQQLESLRGRPVVDTVLDALDYLMQTARPSLIHSQSNVNGLAIVSIDGTALVADFHQLPASATRESYYDRPEALAAMWRHDRYRVARSAGRNGAPERIET